MISEKVLYVVVAAERHAPKMEWEPSDWLQQFASKVAFMLGVVMLVMFIASKVSIGRRNRFGSQMGGGQFAFFAVAVVYLMDLDLIGTTVNAVLRGAWEVAALFGFV